MEGLKMSKFSDYAAPLAEKFKMSQREAEQFLSMMSDVLNDGLREARLVKIKGLGTFKVASVSARKSVNVNTGEPIVIEGRDKISFTPDTGLKERVNSPFAQFETTVVNEGVDFSEIDRRYNNGNDKDNGNEVAIHTNENNIDSDNEKIEADVIVADSSEPAKDVREDIGEEIQTEKSGALSFANEEIEGDLKPRQESNRRLIYGTVALLLLLVVFGAFYFLRDADNAKSEVSSVSADTTQNIVKATEKTVVDSIATTQKEMPTVNPDDYPVLKYGAYEFDGVAAEVTVRKGQTLASISKRYLGPGSEQYVEAFNGRKVVKEGEVVKIPKLVLKKKKK